MRFRSFSDLGFSLHPVLIRLAIVAASLLVNFISPCGDLRRKIAASVLANKAGFVGSKIR